VALLAKPSLAQESGLTGAEDVINIGDVIPERAVGFCSSGVEGHRVWSTKLSLFAQCVARRSGIPQAACAEIGRSVQCTWKRAITTVGMEQGDHYSGLGTGRSLQWTWNRAITTVGMEQGDHYNGHGIGRSLTDEYVTTLLFCLTHSMEPSTS
jgi:hypothetical protein